MDKQVNDLFTTLDKLKLKAYQDTIKNNELDKVGKDFMLINSLFKKK